MKNLPAQMEWYRSDDLLLGFCGFKGDLGVYRYWLDRGGEWQFCAPGTKSWDRYHQKVFLQGRADPCDFGVLAERVPPLPDRFPPPLNAHVADPPEPVTSNVLPGSVLFDRIRSSPDGRALVHVVLREDAYESAVGDGIFRRFESAFFHEEDAESRIAEDTESAGSYLYFIRRVYLVIAEDEIHLDTRESGSSPFDHFTRQQICDDLARRV